MSLPELESILSRTAGPSSVSGACYLNTCTLPSRFNAIDLDQL